MNNKINSLLSRLDEIRDQLYLLASEHEYSFEDHRGSDFPEQDKFAGVWLDNLIGLATDVTAESIRHQQEKIKDLVALIQFRQQYKDFSEADLIKIIDSDSHFIDFRDVLSPAAVGREFLDRLRTIRNDWNATFNNRSYRKVCNSLSNDTDNHEQHE